MGKIRNPKSEIRMNDQIRNPNGQTAALTFGFLISGFGFRASPSQLC